MYAAYKRLTSESLSVYTLKVRRWKKIFYANRNDNKAGITILILDKVDFKMNYTTKDKEGHCIIIKGLLPKEVITLINICVPNTGPLKYVKQILRDIKGELIRKYSQLKSHQKE